MPESKERHPCRHSKAFAFVGGYFMWCPNCGALRRLYPKQQTVAGQSMTVWHPAWKGWVYPRGWKASVERWERFEAERLDIDQEHIAYTTQEPSVGAAGVQYTKLTDSPKGESRAKPT